MLIELDYETVSALESALIVAENSKIRDAKAWGNIAESMGASKQHQAAEDLAAFCRKQANSYCDLTIVDGVLTNIIPGTPPPLPEPEPTAEERLNNIESAIERGLSL